MLQINTLYYLYIYAIVKLSKNIIIWSVLL